MSAAQKRLERGTIVRLSNGEIGSVQSEDERGVVVRVPSRAPEDQLLLATRAELTTYADHNSAALERLKGAAPKTRRATPPAPTSPRAAFVTTAEKLAMLAARSALADAISWVESMHPTKSREQRARMYRRAHEMLFAVLEPKDDR